MAHTPEGDALTAVHRRRQLALRAATLADLARMWRGVDPTDLSGTIRPFVVAATVAIGARNRDSSEVARRYLESFLQVEDGGRVRPSRPEPPPREVVEAAVRGAGLSGIVNARRRGFSPQAAAGNGLVKVAGSATSLVLAGGRQMLVGTSNGQLQGWRRVTSASPCDFCDDLAGDSGPGEFEAHDHCSCTVEPVV